MSLEYVALGMLIFVGLVFFYGILAIHDIPYEIAKRRGHPHLEAIHNAGWISMFTLHSIWPFLWIWATVYHADRGYGFSEPSGQIQKILEKLDIVEQPRLQAEVRTMLPARPLSRPSGRPCAPLRRLPDRSCPKILCPVSPPLSGAGVLVFKNTRLAN